MCLTGTAQNYTREGNTFISSTGERTKQEATKTKFTWKDSKGKEYPVYISKSGSCFVIKVSAKTGKEYRNYLGPEISRQICKELNVEYKSKKGNKV
jgi:hypothetical protein